MDKRNFIKTLFTGALTTIGPFQLALNKKIESINTQYEFDNIFSFGYQYMNNIVNTLNSALIKNDYPLNINAISTLYKECIIHEFKEVLRNNKTIFTEYYHNYLVELDDQILLNFYHKLKDNRYIYFFEYRFQKLNNKMYVFSDTECLNIQDVSGEDISKFMGHTIEWKNAYYS